MDQIYQNSRIGHENQLVYLNTERLIGVQSIDVSNNFALSQLTYAGMGGKRPFHINNGEQSSTINLSTFLINEDYFWGLTTGNESSNVYILRENTDRPTCYSALSGYFTNFSCSYSIGNVPEISTTFISLVNAGPIPSTETPVAVNGELLTIGLSSPDITGSLRIPYGNSISLGISEFSTNRVQSFNINVASNKTPVYNVGSKIPSRIEHQSSQITCNVSFVVADYTAQKLRGSGTHFVRNVNLIAGDYADTGNIVATYSIDNMTLVNENYSAQVNGDVVVSQSYFKKIFPI